MSDPLLSEQIEYYRARADEYDQWFLRQGRYDLGEQENARWEREVSNVERELDAFDARGKVLELAGGTGFWTRRLVRTANELTVVDASAETLELNHRRLAELARSDDASRHAEESRSSPEASANNVRYVVADLFAWEPDQQYDVVVFTFWLSHVPPERFEPFWDLVRRCLTPGGRVFFVDSLGPESTAFDHRTLRPGDISVTRKLNDGRRFRIYKVFYASADLVQRLADLGWEADVRGTEHFLLYGQALRRTGM